MKKINILKAIVDLLWIFSMPVVLIIIGISFTTFFVDLSDLSIELNTINMNKMISSQKYYLLFHL